ALPKAIFNLGVLARHVARRRDWLETVTVPRSGDPISVVAVVERFAAVQRVLVEHGTRTRVAPRRRGRRQDGKAIFLFPESIFLFHPTVRRRWRRRLVWRQNLVIVGEELNQRLRRRTEELSFRIAVRLALNAAVQSANQLRILLAEILEFHPVDLTAS